MRKMLGLVLLGTAVLLAQDGEERIAVPLNDSARPARIRVQLLTGGVTVRGGDTKEVIVEGRSRSDRHEHPARADGMKRLDFPGGGLDISEEDNVVEIKGSEGGGDLTITVPRQSSLQLKALNGGDIVVEQVDGEIDANNLNGKVILRNVSGSVVAHSLNGSVIASLDRIDSSKPMSFSTLNGDIDVTMPDNLKANVVMKTDAGEILTDFDVKLNTVSSVSSEKEGGRYRVRVDRSLRGTIGGGGPELQFTTFNGRIYLRKKK